MGKLSDFFSDRFQPILGGRKYEDWEKGSFKLQTVKIRNKNLAQELEEECNARSGFLTYSEYLTIDQFGKYGFHKTHKQHGFTLTHKNWADAIFQHIKKNNIRSILELGPGDANLATGLFDLASKNNYQLLWNAVEPEDNFREKISKRFNNKKYKNFIGTVSKTIDKIPKMEKGVFISSYCLDSIPPEIFVNTKDIVSPPDSILGIKVKDGILQEFILSDSKLKDRGMKFKKNVFTYKNISYDFSSVPLVPMKRLFVIIYSFDELHEALAKIERPNVFIMDEVRTSLNYYLHSDHYLAPLFLDKKKRYGFNPHMCYERAGEILYYYPVLLPLLVDFMEELEMQVLFDIEPKMVASLLNKTYIPDKRVVRFLCYAVVANGKINKKHISLTFPEPRVVSSSRNLL